MQMFANAVSYSHLILRSTVALPPGDFRTPVKQGKLSQIKGRRTVDRAENTWFFRVSILPIFVEVP